MNTPGEKSSVALLAHFRRKAGLSIRALARAAGLSHPYVGALEKGSVPPNAEAFQKLAEALKLSENDTERLRTSFEKPDLLVAPGVVVDVDVLIHRQLAEEITDVWVASREPVELHDEKWRNLIIKNLKRGCSYVYFVRSDLQWDALQNSLHTREGGTAAFQRVTGILVPAELLAFFFNPGFAIYIANKNRPIGVWTFRGPRTSSIDFGCAMDDPTSYEMYHNLKTIVENAQMVRPSVFSERRLDFVVLEAKFSRERRKL